MGDAGKGEGIRVGVIDTGIDAGNQQLAEAIGPGGKSLVKGKETVDKVGHGTKVAGIIAARPKSGSGFFGIAPEATVIPFQQTTEEKPGTADSLARAIDAASPRRFDIINISQGTGAERSSLPTLAHAIGKPQNARSGRRLGRQRRRRRR